MLQRDYILRLFTKFFQDLAQYLSKKKDEDIEDGIQNLYDMYFCPSSFYYENDVDAILHTLSSYKGQELLMRLEMLAELLYQDALRKSGDGQINLLSKALALYQQLDVESTTFSFERREKMEKMRVQLDDLKKKQ